MNEKEKHIKEQGFKKRLPFLDSSVLRKAKLSDTFRTNSRSSTIIEQLVGKVAEVHNGKTYCAVKITEQMVGHKLGEFVPTRNFKAHGGDKDAKRAAAAKKGGKK